MVTAAEIQSVSLFEGLTQDELGVIAAAMTADSFPEGHIVYRENEVGCACIYIIRKGKVDVIKQSTDNDPMSIAVLRDGNFFGEFSFFDSKPHSATTVVAEHGTIVLSLQRPDFEKAIANNPWIGYKVLINIIHEISSVIRKMNANYIDMTGYMFGRKR
jgi:CRP/FNR family cyclic AMP-dependent transcriptional regulator